MINEFLIAKLLNVTKLYILLLIYVDGGLADCWLPMLEFKVMSAPLVTFSLIHKFEFLYQLFRITLKQLLKSTNLKKYKFVLNIFETKSLISWYINQFHVNAQQYFMVHLNEDKKLNFLDYINCFNIANYIILTTIS